MVPHQCLALCRPYLENWKSPEIRRVAGPQSVVAGLKETTFCWLQQILYSFKLEAIMILPFVIFWHLFLWDVSGATRNGRSYNLLQSSNMDLDTDFRKYLSIETAGRRLCKNSNKWKAKEIPADVKLQMHLTFNFVYLIHNLR